MKMAKMKKKNNKSVKKTEKKKLGDMNVDEFFQQDFTSGTDSEVDEAHESGSTKNRKASVDALDSDDSDMDPEEHKKSLMRLKDTDPEFFSYLEENDKSLLEFNLSDDNDDSEDESDERHIPNPDLEVASDASDYEPEDGDDAVMNTRKITLKLLRSWQEELQKDKSSKTIKNVMEAMHAAVCSVSSSENNDSKFKVEGSAIFNGVIQLCILYLPSSLRSFLKLKSESQFEAHKLKKFSKIKRLLKCYFIDLITILQSVTSSDIISILLKHLHQMLPYTKSYSSLMKPLLKILLKLWSSGEETVRVVAFLNILHIATNHKESILETMLKAMYVKYVENCKFVSPTTLPSINFMRHSLVEIYLLDSNFAYSHAFLYIRQLAIHLRNAMTLKTKESFQAVYNWQYINSLQFWSELMTLSKQESMLRSLLYPLIQIIIGTIKVIPTAQYYPLRFHCVQMLIKISKETDTFIPILPFLFEVLNSYDFNKKHKSVSMKPISFICILRMSKSQLQENGVKDTIIENIHRLLLENAANDSHKVYFPDLYVPCVIQLKTFLKNCRIANYCRKIKQVLDKIEENRKYIESERSKVTLDLKDLTSIKNWEQSIKTRETSLSKFYESWIKIHQAQKLKALTNNDAVGDYKLPAVVKSNKNKDNSIEESEDESDFELTMKGDKKQQKRKLKPEKSVKPKAKKKKTNTNQNQRNDQLPTTNSDIVRDIDTRDWD